MGQALGNKEQAGGSDPPAASLESTEDSVGGTSDHCGCHYDLCLPHTALRGQTRGQGVKGGKCT